MNHKAHTYLMIGAVALGAVLFFSGALGGGSVFLIWILACAGMMFFMMRGMGGTHGGGDHQSDAERDHEHSSVKSSDRR